MTVEIPLTRGKVALIDDDDVSLVAGYTWHAHLRKGHWYAAATVWDGDAANRWRTVSMHRLLAGATPEEDVDHVDGDGLNNRRENIRRVPHQVNMQNQRRRTDNTSGFKGVSWHRAQRKWAAAVQSAGKRYHVGYFATAGEAARAYDIRAYQLFGGVGVFNFPAELSVSTPPATSTPQTGDLPGPA